MNLFANKWVAGWLDGLGRFTLLGKEVVTSLFTLRVSWRDLLYQIHFIGVTSQSVVLVTGAFTGMVPDTEGGLRNGFVGKDRNE